MRRVRDNKYGYRSWTGEEFVRYGKFLLLPLLVIILAVAILIWNRKQGEQDAAAPAESAAVAESQPAESAPEPPAETEAPHEFSTDQNPEIQELMNRYFTAKQSADVETIYQLFGWTDQSGMESLRGQLQYDARYTEGYRNIVCYTRPGLQEGDYLVYVTYDLKFKNSLTLAPGLLWNYVKTGEDGELYLTDAAGLAQAELDAVAEAEKMDEIVLLKTQIYAKLRLALEEDADLAESYGILEKQGGASGSAQGESQHEVTVQIGGGAAEESSAEAPEQTDGMPEGDGSETISEAGQQVSIDAE